MYNQQNDMPEFVLLFATNLTKTIKEFVQTDVHYTYNSETDRLVIILEPLYSIKFAYKMDNITNTLIQTRTTVSMTCYTIIKKYKRHVLGKFLKDTKNP